MEEKTFIDESESIPLFIMIAGNLLQAEQFVRSAGLQNRFWIYLTGPEKLYGLRGANVKAIKVGTWYERKDIHKIDAMLLTQGIATSTVTVERKKKDRYVAILQSVLVKIGLARFPRIRWKLKRKENE